MITLRTVAVTVALLAGAFGIAPAASAGHVVVGVGIGLPGIAVVAPPYAYFGPGYYGPTFVGGPVYGYGYYGRPYFRHGPHAYLRGYATGYRRY
jgi:hypothetical protein